MLTVVHLQPSFPVDISSLPPELEDDFAALQEALIEEKREEADLQRRKEELTGNILSQERELDSLKTSISTLEPKVGLNNHISQYLMIIL